MNSNHHKTVEHDTTNFLEVAKRLLGPDCPVSGQGRWCLKTPMAAYLFETREAAVANYATAP